MSNYATKSLIDIAEEILLEKKAQANMYELFDIACEKKGLGEEVKANLIAQFYTDMISSAKFVYLGENEWDLKEHQEVALWEKDGSYYKEYNKVDIPVVEEVKPKVVEVVKVEPVVEEKLPVVDFDAPTVEDTTFEPAVDAYNEEVMEEETKVEEVTFDLPVEETTEYEDVFEEFEEDDDFDEEKYNEYMDTYEDQYDD